MLISFTFEIKIIISAKNVLTFGMTPQGPPPCNAGDIVENVVGAEDNIFLQYHKPRIVIKNF
jgi:hypothetical protein